MGYDERLYPQIEQVASMDNTDESLIAAHCQGDKTAFGEIVRRYADNMLGYLTRMSGDREEAQDLFQETFKRVHEKAHTFAGGAFKNWLFAIATNVAIDGLRRRKRLRLVSLNRKVDCADSDEEFGTVVAPDNRCNPYDQAIKAEQAEKVRQAIELLPARQRATLILAYYQQLSYGQIAEALGCSIGTVRTQMFRALRKLADRLPDIWDPAEREPSEGVE
jgi:RNA polymerase sigma-70 factor (ECF subfamily)